MIKQYRTTQAVEFDWLPVTGQTRHQGTIPAETLCKKLIDGQGGHHYIVDDLSWIVDLQGMLYHDAYYSGIPVPADMVEEF